MNKQAIFWIIAIVMVIYALNQPPQKEAVADLEGKACTVDKDCPCWGKIVVNGTNTTNYGVGTATCKNNVCDVTYCFDIEPVADWARENPLHYFRTHIWVSILVVVFIVMAAIWPKQ